MKFKSLIVATLLVLFASSAFAAPQRPTLAAAATGHGAALTFNQAEAGASTNIYSAACVGTVTGTVEVNFGIVGVCPTPPAVGAFTLLGNAPAGATGYSDTTRGPGVAVVYYVTTLCPAAGCADGTKGESGPSSMIAVLTPPLAQFTLSSAPSTLLFTFTVGGTNPTSQVIALTSTPAAAVVESVTTDQPWLKATSDSTTTKENVTVTVDPTGLVAGTYTGNVIFTNGDGTAINPTYKVSVTFVVSNAPKPAPPTITGVTVQ